MHPTIPKRKTAGHGAKWLLMVIVALVFLTTKAQAGRARPYINKARTTFVADNGNLLRGPFLSTENGNLPARSRLHSIKDYGCNAVHCYAECATLGYPAGTRVAEVDKLVQWTGEEGLYLVITIGNCEGPVSAEFNAAFWNFYAGRYANEPHVLYEIQNEPAPSPGVSKRVLALEKSAYNVIRSKAPNTPVLFFSYMAFKNGEKVIQDIKALGSGVNWNNAAVAFHGYGEGGREGCRTCLKQVLKAGYPCFQTEFYTWPWGTGVSSLFSPQARYQDVSETGDFERLGVSWLSFLSLNQITDNTRFKDRLQNAGIVWESDYGTWPSGSRGTYGNQGEPWSASSPGASLHIEAENFDNRGQVRSNCGMAIESTTDIDGGCDVGCTEAQERLEYTIYITDPGLYELKLRVSSALGTNKVKVLFGGRDMTGIWSFPGPGGSQAWKTITNTVSLAPGQQVLHVEALSDGFKLNWIELTPAPSIALTNGNYRIIARHSGKALQVAGGARTNGSGLEQGNYCGASNQIWVVTLSHRGANNYKIASLQTGKALDVEEHKRENGSKLQIWDGANSPNQRWLLTPTSDGYYSIIAEHSGLGLAVQGESMATGALVYQWEYAGATNQQWSFQSP